MSIQPKFGKSRLAKAAGWFSRRHKTDEAHKEAQRRRREKRENKIKEFNEDILKMDTSKLKGIRWT
jgi:hypothetical protein